MKKISHCFCQIPGKELSHWAHERFIEKHSTMELLHSTSAPHQKEVISIVALLDVPDKEMLKMMGDVALPEHHILHCRNQVKKMVNKELKLNSKSDN